MDCPRPRSTRDSPEPERHRHGWRWPRGWPGVVREEREDAEALPDPRLFGRSGDRVDGVDVGPAVGPRLVPRLRDRDGRYHPHVHGRPDRRAPPRRPRVRPELRIATPDLRERGKKLHFVPHTEWTS